MKENSFNSFNFKPEEANTNLLISSFPSFSSSSLSDKENIPNNNNNTNINDPINSINSFTSKIMNSYSLFQNFFSSENDDEKISDLFKEKSEEEEIVDKNLFLQKKRQHKGRVYLEDVDSNSKEKFQNIDGKIIRRKYNLTEKDKIEIKKERNKISAKKCREKKKNEKLILEEKIAELEKKLEQKEIIIQKLLFQMKMEKIIKNDCNDINIISNINNEKDNINNSCIIDFI